MTNISKRDKATIVKMLNSKKITHIVIDESTREYEGTAEQILEALKEKTTFIQEHNGVYFVNSYKECWEVVA